ncbi:MAG: Adenylate cyclase, class 3 [Candidatus Kentron sp. G]|nr:MAG: Adenylate cyclase, class 3 [Candidatus Kentron sp. G]VFN01333.1 MAG: Adenylate cyclase, class 3 [Candidatus Kentron sp. G]VFN04009.1 MAG: Adenylate cyclase, class 3 [Candidatus Kentron sp. G]
MPRILIIDDDSQNLDSLELVLGDDNPDWEILIARGELEGETILREQLTNKQPVDVVLTDLVMESDQSGMNILQKVRELDPLAMAILFTAKEKSLDRYAAFEHGAFDVVEKNIRGASAAREINVKTRAALRYREWSRQINFLQRYFDPKLFGTIQRDPSLLCIAQRTITIAFWDIRGFSRLCESLKAHPTLISGFLKEYCELGARTIFEHNGVLDKFIGDGIMALFGVLNHRGDDGEFDALSAVRAGIALRDKFGDVVDKWMEKWRLHVPDKIEIGLGCGIHTGDVLVGNVGTDFRDQFTALGPHVNFASRIESRAAAGRILISQSTQARVGKEIASSFVEEISDIKNIPGTFQLYVI